MMGRKKKKESQAETQPTDIDENGDRVIVDDIEILGPEDPDQGDSGEPQFDNELDRLTAENSELKVQWARSQADYQNQKRRAQADYEAGVRRTLQPFLEQLLQVLDYLDMALAAPVTTDEAKNLSIGIEMTRVQFLAALSSQGVKPVPTEGVFDPTRHEATKAELREDLEAGTILSVVRKGYLRGDEVLRVANVVISKTDEGDAAEVVSEA